MLAKSAYLWCQFVLNEGIMPAPIVRVLKSSYQKKRLEDWKKLASILLDQRGLALDSDADSDIMAVAKEAFKGDLALTNWLDHMKHVLSVIVSGDADSFPDMIEGALISFIKACPFVSDEQKQKYLLPVGMPRPVARRKSSKYNDEQAQQFEQFLLQHGYSYGTACSYKSAISYIAKCWCSELWEVTDLEDIQKIKDYLNHNQEYQDADRYKHAALSNGFARYCEFLESLSNEASVF